MQVLRKQNLEVEEFMVGDQIQVGKYTATCQKITDGKAIFLLDQYLDEVYQMNRTNTNIGGYVKSDLRSALKNATVDENFASIKERLIPFKNGDLLRIATVGELFGNDDDCEMDNAEQWELMKERKNRIAIREGGAYGDWLQNILKGSSTSFARVSGSGHACYLHASDFYGVRPVFQLAKEESGDLASHGNWVSYARYAYEKNKDTASKETLLDKETSKVKDLMDSYIRVGFTKEQAFQIILTTIIEINGGK